MMAAITAARQGAGVTLLEPNDRLGKKLNITGKGRCNVTNNCSREELLQNIPRNGRFLYGAFARFDSRDAMAFFEKLGVPLKTGCFPSRTAPSTFPGPCAAGAKGWA